ncbi:carbonic anhydrase [Longispora sp. K20-0274]|uniref:carbonic anhydrase n=1 Tax=Longispora sp. K20-0274 TaxID=3088255 RepID=UPI00399A78BA
MPPDLPLPPSRRHVLRVGGLLAAGLFGPTAMALASDVPTRTVTAADQTVSPALRGLLDGNHRYATGHARHPDADARRRRQTAHSQHPTAIVLGCVDSRVPPEIIFDQGLGDLLTVRTAGPTLDATVLASISYGVVELGIDLLVVLGHQRCGAVTATVAEITSGTATPPELRPITGQIAPAVRQARSRPGDLVENTMIAHVDQLCDDLRAQSGLTSARSLTVVGAHLQLETGHVTLHQ